MMVVDWHESPRQFAKSFIELKEKASVSASSLGELGKRLDALWKPTPIINRATKPPKGVKLRRGAR